MTTPEPVVLRPSLVDFALASPPTWFWDRQASSVWVAVYRMAMVRRESLPARPISIPMGDTHALIHWGTVQYTDTSQARMTLEADYSVRIDGAAFKATESLEGAWLAVVTPHKTDGIEGQEPTSRRRLAAAIGLLQVLHGNSAAYALLTEGEVEFKDLQIASYGHVFRSPHALPAPDLSLGALASTCRAVEASAHLSLPDRNRLSLALHWYCQAAQEDGVDGLLKGWIALEVLAMPDTSDISAIQDSLARAYGLTRREAGDTFLIGKLFGLRSRIVHDGRTPELHGAVNLYLQSIFADVLADHLSLPPRRTALAWVDRQDISIEALVDAALLK